MQLLRRRLRGPFAELIAVRGALLAVAGAFALLAATPAPGPTRIDVTKIQPKALLPKTKLHSEFVVDVNKLGQVSRVRSMKSSGDKMFNAQTFGNAQQAFIRTADGSAIVGSYKMTYDFNPATGRVHREAALVKRGGVDPDAKGLVIQMEEIARRHTPAPLSATPEPRVAQPRTPEPRTPEPRFVMPSPQGTIHVDNKRLPDLQQIIHSPTP